MIDEKKFSRKIIESLQGGGIGVIPTDTIYGIVGSALSKDSVKRIYKVRKRNQKKPMIILISKLSDLAMLDIKLNKTTRKILDKFWPGKVSIIFQSSSRKFKYLDRGLKTLAFRLPKDKKLRNVISHTGPLVAPSANPEGMTPAVNIKEAKRYFGNRVDFYVDHGNLKSKPSKIIAIINDKVIIKRK